MPVEDPTLYGWTLGENTWKANFSSQEPVPDDNIIDKLKMMSRIKPLDEPGGFKNYTLEDKNKRKKSLRAGVRQYFKNYCSTSSIHGFSYFGEHRTWIEYTWWIVVFILSMTACIYMIYEIYKKWWQSPVIVSFATKNRPVFDIPLPAITVCPVSKLRKNFFNLTQFMERDYNMTDIKEAKRQKKLAQYMGILCRETYPGANEDDFVDAEDFFSILRDHSVQTTPISTVQIDGDYYEFAQVFKETYTQQGLCYTFNRLNLKEIYSDNVVINEREFEDFPESTWDARSEHHSKGSRIKEYPRRVIGAGMNNGIIIHLIDNEEDNDHHCNPIWNGFTVTIHYPSRIPRTREQFLLTAPDSAMAIPIEASMVLTSKRVRNYEPLKRDCYFLTERHLQFFRAYTQNNCYLECLTNHTLNECGCVEFYMPRENGTKICGSGKMDCALNVAKTMRDTVMQKSVGEDFGMNEFEKQFDDDCGCLPTCIDVTYHYSAEPLNINPRLLSGFKKFLKKGQLSTVLIYFKDSRISTTERNELYGPTDFISNFGGLLGLFTGFSILSCMEIVYFLTLRIFGNIRLFGYWAGPGN